MAIEQPETHDIYPQWRAWATWGCAGAFFFYQFVVRVSPSVFTDDLMLDLRLSACDYSGLISIYYIGYSSVQLFVGLVMDRLGVRYPLIFASVMIFTGCMIFSYSYDLQMLVIARFMIGVGSALGFLSCVKTASMWFTSERLGLMIGLSVMIGMAGATSGGYPMAYLVGVVGWRQSMFVLAIVAAALIVLTLFLARDRHHPVGQVAKVDDHKFTIMESIVVLLKNPQNWLYALYGVLMFVPMSVFADAWGIKYITMLYNVEKTDASGAVSMTYVGVGLSGPILAIVADNWRSYKKLMMVGSVVSMLGYVVAIYVVLPSFIFAYPLFLFTGFALGAQFFAFASIVELNPRQVSATASGLQNMAAMFGSGGVVYLVGVTLDYVSDGRLDNLISRYVVADFHIALAAVPVCMAIACVLLVIMKEAYPKESDVVAG